jgi:hypothetical protein
MVAISDYMSKLSTLTVLCLRSLELSAENLPAQPYIQAEEVTESTAISSESLDVQYRSDDQVYGH